MASYKRKVPSQTHPMSSYRRRTPIDRPKMSPYVKLTPSCNKKMVVYQPKMPIDEADIVINTRETESNDAGYADVDWFQVGK